MPRIPVDIVDHNGILLSYQIKIYEITGPGSGARSSFRFRSRNKIIDLEIPAVNTLAKVNRSAHRGITFFMILWER